MNFLKFDEFLVPKIIKFFYTIVVFASLAVALYIIFTAVSNGIKYENFTSQIPSILSGLGVGILVPLSVRIWTELTLLLFKIEENTRKKR